MVYDLTMFEDIKPMGNGKGAKKIDTYSCRKCKKNFKIGEIIYRIVEQDYQKGAGNNPKHQTNKIRICKECFDKLFALGVENE